jgi:hypothetical protein
MKDTNRTTYQVEYTYCGHSLTMTFKGTYEDGSTAKERALDYYDTALCTLMGEPDSGAKCIIHRNGKEWLDTTWG